jgi:hypothetical protein
VNYLSPLVVRRRVTRTVTVAAVAILVVLGSVAPAVGAVGAVTGASDATTATQAADRAANASDANGTDANETDTNETDTNASDANASREAERRALREAFAAAANATADLETSGGRDGNLTAVAGAGTASVRPAAPGERVATYDSFAVRAERGTTALDPVAALRDALAGTVLGDYADLLPTLATASSDAVVDDPAGTARLTADAELDSYDPDDFVDRLPGFLRGIARSLLPSIGAGYAGAGSRATFEPAAGGFAPATDGTVTVTSRYSVEGSTEQLRESEAFGNSVTRVGVRSVVTVYDRTEGRVVADASRTHYDTTTPSPDDLVSEGVVNVVAEGFDRLVGAVLGVEAGSELLSFLDPETVSEDLEAGGAIDERSAELSVDVDAEAGHRYDVVHETYAVVIVGGLNADTSGTADATVTLERVSVTREAETSPDPTSRTARVVLDGAPAGLGTANLTVDTPGTNATLVRVEASPDATLSQVAAGGVGSGSVTHRSLFESFGPTDRRVTLLTVEFSDPVSREALSLDATVTDANGSAVADSRPSLVVETNPFPDGVPGLGPAPPGDPDGDGRYEDVDGDGDRTLADVFALAFEVVPRTGSLSDAQVAALDFDGDGGLDLADVFALAFE